MAKPETVREPFRMTSAAVTVPYSPEFGEMENNPALLERLSTITGGKIMNDDAAILDKTARSGEVFRSSPTRNKSLQSIWYWLLVLTGVGLFFDIAVRRVGIDPEAASLAVQEQWLRLRGKREAVATTRNFSIASNHARSRRAKNWKRTKLPDASSG